MGGLEPIERIPQLNHGGLEALETNLDVDQLTRSAVLSAFVPAEQPGAVENCTDEREAAADDDEWEKMSKVHDSSYVRLSGRVSAGVGSLTRVGAK